MASTHCTLLRLLAYQYLLRWVALLFSRSRFRIRVPRRPTPLQRSDGDSADILPIRQQHSRAAGSRGRDVRCDASAASARYHACMARHLRLPALLVCPPCAFDPPPRVLAGHGSLRMEVVSRRSVHQRVVLSLIWLAGSTICFLVECLGLAGVTDGLHGSLST